MHQLACAPAGLPYEAPASWLTRVALSQGVSMREFLAVLPRRGLDLDLATLAPDYQGALAAFGLDPSALVAATKIFTNFCLAGLSVDRFLLFKGKRPRYRYCAGCFAQMREPHIPVHWRFSCWRYCPIHMCHMNDSCLDCDRPIVLPASLVLAGPQSNGVAYLTTCLHCGANLSHMAARGIVDADTRDLSNWTLQRLMNGRAVLAALYWGEVRLSPDGGSMPVGALVELERRGILPTQPMLLHTAAVAGSSSL